MKMRIEGHLYLFKVSEFISMETYRRKIFQKQRSLRDKGSLSTARMKDKLFLLDKIFRVHSFYSQNKFITKHNISPYPNGIFNIDLTIYINHLCYVMLKIDI